MLKFVSAGKERVRVRTYIPKGAEARELTQGRQWYVVDADGQVLGRLAARVARLLIGKDKPNFTPHLDCGDHVVVINAERIRLTGNKLEQKVYYRHSGYPGGLKEIPIKRLLPGRADTVVREAILGMLPKNKLRAHRARKLKVYRDARGLERHTAQKPARLSL
jgi:large subunit ribosomal protein L13